MKDQFQQYGELGLGSRLKRLSEYMMKEIQMIYIKYEIDFDSYLFPVFKVIIDQNIATTTDIQEKLKYTQPAITQILKKLMARKLVDYKIDASDKRKKVFQLTKKGKKTHQDMIPLWKVFDQQVKNVTTFNSTNLMDHLTVVENKFIEKSLSKRILENLK